MTQAHHGGERRDADQVPDDSRAARVTRRRARDRVVLTQPPPPPPEPVRPERDGDEPPAAEQPTSRSAGDDLISTIDELIADR